MFFTELKARFEVGTRYLLDNQVYLIRQILLDGQLLVENQSFGGQQLLTRQALEIAWATDRLHFEISGPHTTTLVTVQPNNNDLASKLATRYTFADFQQLLPTYQQEAWRRYQLILPLLKLPPRERSRQYYQAYLTQFHC
jgi:hypothetical protein